MARELTLLFHFLGFGLLMTTAVAGFIINSQYRKADNLQSKSTILRTMRPLGLLSPLGILIMLITGIGNMHALGVGLFTLGWLSYKIVFFAIAAISGIIFGLQSKKRGALVSKMAAGNAPADADRLLKAYDQQVSLSYIVMPLLLLLILWLSVYGRLGGQ